jgi:hypothetical protein
MKAIVFTFIININNHRTITTHLLEIMNIMAITQIIMSISCNLFVSTSRIITENFVT